MLGVRPCGRGAVVTDLQFGLLLIACATVGVTAFAVLTDPQRRQFRSCVCEPRLENGLSERRLQVRRVLPFYDWAGDEDLCDDATPPVGRRRPDVRGWVSRAAAGG